MPGQGGSPAPGAGFPLCTVVFLILTLVDVQMGPQFAAAEEQVCFSKYFGSSEGQQVPVLVAIPGRSPGCVLQPAEQWLLPAPGVKLMCLLPGFGIGTVPPFGGVFSFVVQQVLINAFSPLVRIKKSVVNNMGTAG